MEVLAHGLGGRSDLPIPLWLAVYGATAAVLISFYVLARFWKEPKFYVWWWVGLVPASLLFGPVARLLSPMRTVATVFRGLLGRQERSDELAARLGWWPAVVSLAAFLWLELASDFADSPRVVAVFLSAYAIAHVIAGEIVGPAWFDRGRVRGVLHAVRLTVPDRAAR